MKELPLIVKDILDAIHNDSWMYVCVWGPPRTGKSTFCMNLMWQIYQDWEKVLDANLFNLNQLLYKIQKGVPELWPTRNKLHMRIPILNWDDFAAHSGKARTQHERSFDIFKGAFDTLGTKIGVLLVNMVSPRSPTQQLQEKYTHEVWITSKGHYKYDAVKWRQDFRGWRAQMKKDWIDQDTFDQIPMSIFKQYDEMRMELADEVLQIVQDSLVDTHMGSLLKRVNALDLQLLTLIQAKGPVRKSLLPEDLKPSVVRCRGRGLITPQRIGAHYYKYDITDLGESLLAEKARLVDKTQEMRV